VLTYFALTFVISWGGVLLVIGGPAGIPGTSEQLARLLPPAILAMLMHASLTASTFILGPLAISGIALLTYGLALAAALWVVVAAVAVANRVQLSQQPLRSRPAAATEQHADIGRVST
jgi:ABC-type transport system involved in multi-copper enzyme maturation permease subunit